MGGSRVGLEQAYARTRSSHLSFFLHFNHSLIDTLKGPGPFTVFAPTDEAFGKIDPATLNAILADQAKLTSILTYHVVSGTLRCNTR